MHIDKNGNLYQGDMQPGDRTATQAEIAAAELARSKTALKQAAQAELDATDLVCLRCYKAGVSYPAAWQAYTMALRAIVSGTDTTSTALPTRPAYPAGT